MIRLVRHENGNYFCPDDPAGDGRRSVSDQEAEILASAALGKRVLEIGTGLGVSTRALASTARHVWTVDTSPWICEFVFHDLPENVTPTMVRDLVRGPCDLAFIDGEHSAQALAADIAFAVSLGAREIWLHDLYMVEEGLLREAQRHGAVEIWKDADGKPTLTHLGVLTPHEHFRGIAEGVVWPPPKRSD